MHTGTSFVFCVRLCTIYIDYVVTLVLTSHQQTYANLILVQAKQVKPESFITLLSRRREKIAKYQHPLHYTRTLLLVIAHD